MGTHVFKPAPDRPYDKSTQDKAIICLLYYAGKQREEVRGPRFSAREMIAIADKFSEMQEQILHLSKVVAHYELERKNLLASAGIV